MKKIIIGIALCFLIFGTNNYSELNHLAIITNVGIEKNKDNYTVTFQEIVPKKQENKIIKTYNYYENSSNSIKNTFKLLEEDLTKEIYLDHLENIIIHSDDDKILSELLSYFQKDFDHFNIIYTENNPKDVMKYSSNYKYVNHLIDNNTSFRSVKKAKLEKKKINIPVVKFKDKKLIFYKYKELKKFES